MGIKGQLNAGESVVFHTRTHPKAILVPVAFAVVVLAAAIAATVYVSNSYGRIAIWVVAAVIIAWRTLVPVAVWLAATYTVTDRRVITRTGIVTRKGHDIPLNRVSDVSFEKGIIDRLFGCGTLIVADASTQGRVELPDVPHVEQRQRQISDLLHRDSTATETDGDH